jgi:hypothetical protein
VGGFGIFSELSLHVCGRCADPEHFVPRALPLHQSDLLSFQAQGSTEQSRKGSIGSAIHGPGTQANFEGIAVASADGIDLGTRLYVDAYIQVVTVCPQIWGACF